MTMRRVVLFTLALGLSACAASGSADDVNPVLLPTGEIAPQRNLLLSDLSFASNAAGRAVDEEFDLQTAGFAAAPDPAGSSTGLVLGETDVQTFGGGSKMMFDATTREFQFNVVSGAGSVTQAIADLFLEDPVDIGGVDNSAYAKLYAAFPSSFSGAFTGGVPAIDSTLSIVDIANAMTALQDGQTEETEVYNAISAIAETLLSFDNYAYSYTPLDDTGAVIPGASAYISVTNMNDPEDGESRRTDSVGIMSFYESYADGSELVQHIVFGHRTPLAEMPTTGTVQFEGKIVGSVLTNNAIQSLTGSSFLDVDFATGLVDARLATIIRESSGQDGGNTFFDYKTMTGSGVISDTTFGGTLLQEGGNATGEFSGGFFAPIANEAGGTFWFADDAAYATGAFTSRQVEEDTAN